MPSVFKLPYHFVDYLTNPGLQTMAGQVPLNQYMSLSKSNGGNVQIDALLSHLRARNIKDVDSRLTIDATVGWTELNLVWKGQGHADAFVKVMDFLCNNQDQFKGIGGELGKVYTNYFEQNRDEIALQKMVAAKYFGIDCIGFVANYLRYVGLWDKYKPYEIDQWDRVFPKNVRKVDDIQPLNLMIWPGKHVAIIDWVYDSINGGKRQIDVCQSSSGGPLCHEDVYLSEAGRGWKGYTQFQITGKVPVGGFCYVMSWPSLNYQQPYRPASYSVFPAAGN
jgi:hypothetical protein